MSLIAFIKKERYGFIKDDRELESVVNENRLAPVLVRCGCGRFTCPAQDVKHFTQIVTKSGDDYVRDISLL